MTLQAAVADRAKKLDQVKPGWAALVDVQHLDMMSRCAPCILDYVFAEEASSQRVVGAGFLWARDRLPWTDCGAFADASAIPYWLTEINARLGLHPEPVEAREEVEA